LKFGVPTFVKILSNVHFLMGPVPEALDSIFVQMIQLQHVRQAVAFIVARFSLRRF